jgi:hypothetical protein
MNATQLLPPPASTDSLPPPGTGRLPPSVDTTAQRRRRWPWVLLGVAVTVVALTLLGLVMSVVVPTSLIDDDLDDGSGPFAHESDELVTLDYVDGGYAMVLEPAPDNWQSARSFWEPSERSVSVAASFEVRQTGSQDYFVGIGCKAAGATYQFVIEPHGYAALLVSTDASEILTGGEITPPPPTSGRLELTCQGGGDRPTELVGSLDGVEVISYSHVNGFESFNAMVLTAWSDDGLDVLWDDPLAERS